MEVDNTVTVEGSDIAASTDGFSVSSTPPIISVTSPGDVPTMEEHIDVVTSTDLCINTDDGIDMQDGTSLCDSETKTDSDESDLEEANRNSQVETVEKPTCQGPTPP